MPFHWDPRDHVSLGRYVIKWLLIAVPMGMAVGAAVALFLWGLETATRIRWSTDMGSGIPWLLFLLPVAGVGISLIYKYLGKPAEGGNNLIIDQIHDPGGGVPRRMAPLILVCTVITHLFGGSAGREGTAIQMGGSMASGIGRIFGLDRTDTRMMLTAGIAAGFGSVFGVPIAGTVFAVEVLAIGVIRYEAILPCLIASVAANWTTQAVGIHHTHYFIGNVGQIQLMTGVAELSWLLLGKVAIAAIAFGLGSVVFAELVHGLQVVFKRLSPWPLGRPVLGGFAIIALAYLVAPDYLGLGVHAAPNHPDQVSILSCFHEGGATTFSWWWKTLFTTVTLASGFKGGEVTPLFFIGAALGNTMAVLLHAPVGLFAALGFVALFAGATNTPLACTIMGIELFSGQPELMNTGFAVYLATACFLSYLFSGHSGIYLSQRIGIPKCLSPDLPSQASLRTARGLKPSLGIGRLLERRHSQAMEHHRPDSDQNQSPEITKHPAHHKPGFRLAGREIGLMRISLSPADRRPSNKFKKMFTRPLYKEIIDAAKADGLLQATAHPANYGFSGEGTVQAENPEVANTRLNLNVDLIGHRDQLERFCRKHGDLLQGKVIVYKHMEQWNLDSHQVLKIDEAKPDDLVEEE